MSVVPAREFSVCKVVPVLWDLAAWVPVAQVWVVWGALSLPVAQPVPVTAEVVPLWVA